ncbi:hypothetical protein [Flammeovirga sp. SubArs3]|uniref:hypothetical protein n=1 Tax=Flammeovirga sp. SubArs3 TaxID=2995316 RepID=UPI00248B3418|nr:hypothetical protein [Flammeovirga sp. SubArs3]
MRKLLFTLTFLISYQYNFAQDIVVITPDEAQEKFRQMVMSSEVNTGGLQELRYYIETSQVNLDDYLYIGELLQQAPRYTESLLESARQISFSRRESNVYRSLIELPLLDLANIHTKEISNLMRSALMSKSEESDAKIQGDIDILIKQCHYKDIEAFKKEQL